MNTLDENLIHEEDNKFQSYREFISTTEATPFIDFLKSKDIPYRIESSNVIIDKAIVGDGLMPKVIVKILASDFEKLNNLLAQEIKNMSYENLSDHYLMQFDSQELQQILQEQDQWSIENIQVAKIILKHRGEAVEEAEVKALADKRYAEIRKGKQGHPFWMVMYAIGIIAGLFISLLFFVASIGMASYYTFGTNVDPNGKRYYVYNASTRKVGRWMFYGGIAISIIGFTLTFIGLPTYIFFKNYTGF